MTERLGCLPILLFLLLLVLLPFVFAQVMSVALVKLHLSPQAALLVMLGILFGSFIHIPIKRIVRDEDLEVHPFPLFGFRHIFPRPQPVRRETVIAVNLGGCVIPVTVACYEIWQLLMNSRTYALAAVIAVGINTAVCYRVARPVKGIGIAMPALVPPLVAVLSALLLAPEQAPPLAFAAGVLGPVLGADVVHLRDIPRLSTGLASIGGAGTFDGIVLSGILAAYLA